MAEIIMAKCTVCGKVFEGENCVREAEDHEKIPIEKPNFEIGNLIVNIDSDTYIHIHKIHHVFPNSFDHKTIYNNNYTFDNSFKLQIKEIEGVKTINKLDLLNNPIYCDLRSKIIEIEIDKLLKDILQNRSRYEIDKVFKYKTEE